MNPARLRKDWAQLGQLEGSISLTFRTTQCFAAAVDECMVAQLFMVNLV
jgi:hypothetical protein